MFVIGAKHVWTLSLFASELNVLGLWTCLSSELNMCWLWPYSWLELNMFVFSLLASYWELNLVTERIYGILHSCVHFSVYSFLGVVTSTIATKHATRISVARFVFELSNTKQHGVLRKMTFLSKLICMVRCTKRRSMNERATWKLYVSLRSELSTEDPKNGTGLLKWNDWSKCDGPLA